MAQSGVEDIRRAIRAEAPGPLGMVRRIAFLAVAVAGIGATGFRYFHRTPIAPTYETAQASVEDVQVTIPTSGSLEATATVEVGAEVTGRLSSVLVDTNDTVKKGQLLAVIDPEQLQASNAESEAQVAAADAHVTQARATLVQTTKAGERAREQGDRGLLAQKDLEAATAEEERARAELDSAVANATLARAKLSENRSRLAKTRIVAPIDGIVLSRNVAPGQTVTAGFQTPLLFRLAQDLTQLRLNADIDEADVGRVHAGQRATFTVDAYPERTFESRVLSLGNDPTKSQGVVTYRSVLSVDNHDGRLRPGMTCAATILADTHEGVLVVPNAALRFTPPGSDLAPPPPGADRPGRQHRVWLLKAGAPTAVPVRVGVTDGRVTEVLGSDLTAGAAVIVDRKGGD